MNDRVTCTHCNAVLDLVGEEDFRTGGHTGMAGALFAGWNQLDIEILALQMYRCPQCGQVEFFLPGGAT